MEQVTYFFSANTITEDDKKRQVFLTCVGTESFHLMKTLVAPAKLDTKTVAELADLVQAHLDPKSSIIVSRYKFNSCNRKAGEPVADYIVHLRQLAKDCDFKASLNDMLRDQLVCGVNDDRIQLKLLAEKDTLTFENAMELALAMEAASKNAKDLCAGIANATVNAVKQGNQSKSPKGKCFSCGANHLCQSCKYRDAECHKCHKKGHISRVCGMLSSTTNKHRDSTDKGGKGKNSSQAHRVELHSPSSPSIASDIATDRDIAAAQNLLAEYQVFAVRSENNKSPPVHVTVKIQGRFIDMEVDTGAAVSLIDETTYHKYYKSVPLKETEIRRNSYTNEIEIEGCLDVDVEYNRQHAKLPLVIVKGRGPPLLGRNWLHVIRLGWPNLLNVRSSNPLNNVVHEFPELFSDGLGLFNGQPEKLAIDNSVSPIFCKARSVPFALKPRIEQATDRNVKEGIWEPVQYSEWAAPIVPMQKTDGTVRLCGDYKVTCNKALQIDKYPIPSVNDIFEKLAGGKTFTKIDLSQAYSLIPVQEESLKYLTVNTHKGMFKVTRLPFGISSAPGIFQRLMDCVVGDIPGVACYVDDIVVTGAEESEHIATVQKVLERLRKAGLKVKPEKCAFMLPNIT